MLHVTIDTPIRQEKTLIKLWHSAHLHKSHFLICTGTMPNAKVLKTFKSIRRDSIFRHGFLKFTALPSNTCANLSGLQESVLARNSLWNNSWNISYVNFRRDDKRVHNVPISVWFPTPKNFFQLKWKIMSDFAHAMYKSLIYTTFASLVCTFPYD